MKPKNMTRRRAVKLGAMTALPLVHIRTAGAAGKLNVGLWDHWVPRGNDVMKKQIDMWAAKNQVEVQQDYITSQGNKLLLTAAAEAQAKTGHDFIPFLQWDTIAYADDLEPVDDVIKHLSDKYGKYDPVIEYLAKSKGHWAAVPATDPTANLTCCARISMMKQYAGIDIQEMYPARPSDPALSTKWTYDAFLKAAEACHKAGVAFGMGLGQTGDSVNNTGAIFSAYGADLMNAKGDITINSDNVRQVMEYGRQFVKYLPPDTVSYDDASNNRALISGKSALIWNPPSAWAVAKRDAPKVAEDCWSFPAPAGPKGRFTPAGPWFWGIWRFSKNQTAAKELMAYLLDRPQSEARAVASEGFDVPPFAGMLDFPIWAEVGPPKGTLYSYPPRTFHDGIPCIAGAPAPPSIGVQIYSRGIMPTMLAKLQSGQSIPAVIGWAKGELEGFVR